MVDTITKTIVLRDKEGRLIKQLKTGMTTQVRVQNVSIYKIHDKEFSNINNKNKQGD